MNQSLADKHFSGIAVSFDDDVQAMLQSLTLNARRAVDAARPAIGGIDGRDTCCGFVQLALQQQELLHATANFHKLHNIIPRSLHIEIKCQLLGRRKVSVTITVCVRTCGQRCC